MTEGVLTKLSVPTPLFMIFIGNAICDICFGAPLNNSEIRQIQKEPNEIEERTPDLKGGTGRPLSDETTVWVGEPRRSLAGAK